MATTDNQLVAVTTYQPSALGRLTNMYCFISQTNKKFENFQNTTGNLGNAVDFSAPARAYANPGLIVNSYDTVKQEKFRLQVGGYNSVGAPTAGGAYDEFGNLNAANVNLAVSGEQLVFNLKNDAFRNDFENSAMEELGTQIETSVAGSIINGTYRFYTPGITVNNTPMEITSYQQVANAVVKFRNFGAVKTDTEFFMSDLCQAQVVGSGLGQFVPRRNEETANSWEIGTFNKTDFYVSNLLPIHTAGTLGDEQAELTVTSVVADADGGISQIVCSGAGTGTVVRGDLAWFLDGVSGQPNIRYRTYIGHKPCANEVQIQITANATGSAGSITLNIYPKLYSAPGKEQNLSTAIAAGMKLKVLPTHRAGLICSGKPFFLAMPRLPDQYPYPTANKADSDSGAAIRMSTGATLGQNIYGTIFDAIWGAKLVPHYAMRVIFPLTQ